MGLAIENREFTAEDFAEYRLRLNENLAALRELLADPGFAVGPCSIGAELEMSMVNGEGFALPMNQQVLEACANEHTQPELDSFNLEYNFTPGDLAGNSLSNLRNQISHAIDSLDSFARDFGGRVVSIGILPTLRKRDLTPSAMTDLPRYHALNQGLKSLKEGNGFDIDINGLEHLKLSDGTLTLEGANTSFQLHLRVNPKDFADSFNAAQLVTPLALATSVNSPIFLETLLWDETRVALFKQSTDTRLFRSPEWRRTSRVPFGHGWVRRGAQELFDEAVALHQPILPVVDTERAPQVLEEGGVPALQELRLLQGTIWQWNRPVYDPALGGHLRIELRALPAGPTPLDMAANAAFFFGLVLHYRQHAERMISAMPFRYAEYNFYRTAQFGLDAKILWPTLDERSPRECTVRELIDEALPHARAALLAHGVDAGDVGKLLDVIAQRNETGITGSRWQREAVQRLERGSDRRSALTGMFAQYMANQASGRPVGRWEPAD